MSTRENREASPESGRRTAARVTGLAVAVVVGTLLALKGGHDEVEAPSTADATPPPGRTEAASARGVEPEPTLSAPPIRAAANSATAPPEPPAALTVASTDPAPLGHAVTGVVVDIDGATLAGVAVRIDGRGEPLCVSGPDGSFRAELSALDVTLVVDDPRFVAIRGSRVSARTIRQPQVIVAAPAVALIGTVRDPHGGPIDACRLVLRVSVAALAGCPVALDTTIERAFGASTDAGGAYRIAPVPAVRNGLLLEAEHPEHVPVAVEVSLDPTTPVTTKDLILDPRSSAPTVFGVVIHADGRAADGAEVFLGTSGRAFTSSTGEFSLVAKDVPDDAALVAALPGLQPAVVPSFGTKVAGTGAWPEPVHLVLGGPALSIAGHLVSWSGEPCVGWTVVVDDGTPLSQEELPPRLVEDLARETSSPVVTGADGSFRVDGLCTRAYVLGAFDKGSFLRIQSDPIPAGRQNVVLQLPADPARERVTGRVVSVAGTPIEGAVVHMHLVLHELEHGRLTHRGKSARTGPDGWFTLDDVPAAFIRLDVSGPDLLPASVALDGLKEGEELLITVERRLRFRFEDQRREQGAAAIRAIDAAGTIFPLVTFDSDGVTTTTDLELGDGQSHVVGVSERAETLVLLDASGVEIGRTSLGVLEPGQVSVVRP